ncbi:hypothetical protein DIPPA_18008 [Diplonema papillatum]|nr:hypothetical protein DIPPA_18008 [Diplonema papillatum]
MPMPWVSSLAPTSVPGLAHLETLFNLIEPVAMLQILQAKLYHGEALQQDQNLHSEALKEGFRLHEAEMAKSVELTQQELQEANRLHKESLEQASYYHTRETKQAKDIMDRDHELTNTLHDVSMWAQRLLHSDNKKYTLKLFKKELEHAQSVSRRENIRDTLVQESARAQATMIVNTLMVGCCFGIIVEGNLPSQTQPIVVIAFSLSLTLALSFLVISVWFAMNLQSRIAKYRISNPNVKYGKKKRQHSNFRSYYTTYCKPVYRMTHAFLWFGTISLLICGCIIMGARLAYTHDSPEAASIFMVCQCACILVLASLLCIYNPKLSKFTDKDDEEDWNGYQDFVGAMEKELTQHDHECKACRLPVDIFEYCPVSGKHHPSSNICPNCNITMTSFKYCPATGKAHEVDSPHTKHPSRHNRASPFLAARDSLDSSNNEANETINDIMQQLHHSQHVPASPAKSGGRAGNHPLFSHSSAPNPLTNVHTASPFFAQSHSDYSPASTWRNSIGRPAVVPIQEEPYLTVQSPHGTTSNAEHPPSLAQSTTHFRRSPPASPSHTFQRLTPVLGNLTPTFGDMQTPPSSDGE